MIASANCLSLRDFCVAMFFFIIKNNGLTRIPDKYINNRWKQTHLLIVAQNLKDTDLDVYATLD